MIHWKSKGPERVLLVCAAFYPETEAATQERLRELALLAATAGGKVVGEIVQRRHAPDPKYFVGQGKAQEIAQAVKRLAADTVIFNNDLSPGQLKNLEDLFEVKTVDRTMLILDIFSKNARTHESKIQVELAQLSYLAPRLTRLWSHFSQQLGGIGTRGPGETQLEVDKRILKKKMGDLKKKLEQVERQRGEQKRGREKLFKATLVGYTNAGKSTLMNALTRAGVLVENKLFATLDSTTRRLFIQGHGEILLTDTVGFIRDLPPHLVASFRSTLSVITEADLIVQVIDASSPEWREHQAVVNAALNELKTDNVPRLVVFNKSDLLGNDGFAGRLRTEFPEALFLSALKGEGVDAFKGTVLRRFLKARKPGSEADRSG